MNMHLRAIALTAATLPLLAAPAMASDPLDARSLALGGHYSAYANSDVNGTLLNPALLQSERGFLYLGPNLGFSAGNNAFGLSDVSSLQAWYQSYSNYIQFSQGISTSGKVDYTQPLPKTPTSLNTAISQGLSVDLGARTGLFGLKIPVPSLFGVRLPSDPKPPMKPLRRVAAASGSVGVSSLAASSSVESASASAMVTTRSASPSIESASGSLSPNASLLGKPTVSVVKQPTVLAAADSGLAWGAVGARVWGDGGADLTLSAPVLFGFVANYPTLDQTLKTDIQGLKTLMQSNDANPGAIGAQVTKVRSDITSNDGFGALLPQSASDKGDRSFTLGETNRAYATSAFSLSQPIPIPNIPFFPKARATLGGSFKLFYGPGSFNLPTSFGVSGTNAPLPVGAPGSMKFQVTTNIAQPLSELNTALDNFSKDYSQYQGVQTAVQDFSKVDLTKIVSASITSRAANSLGSGVDVGGLIDLDDRLSVGASILNPVVFWPGTQTVYRSSSFSNGQFQFAADGNGTTAINFTDTEPMALAMGAAYHLPLGFNLMGDIQQSFEQDPNGHTYSPSVQGGVEWNIFNVLYARAGARLGGPAPMYGAGVGVNLLVTKLDLAAGVDPSLRSANIALSTGLGF